MTARRFSRGLLACTVVLIPASLAYARGLALAIDELPSELAPEARVEYRVTATNASDGPLRRVELQHVLPEGLRLIDAQASHEGVCDQPPVSCQDNGGWSCAKGAHDRAGAVSCDWGYRVLPRDGVRWIELTAITEAPGAYPYRSLGFADADGQFLDARDSGHLVVRPPEPEQRLAAQRGHEVDVASGPAGDTGDNASAQDVDDSDEASRATEPSSSPDLGSQATGRSGPADVSLPPAANSQPVDSAQAASRPKRDWSVHEGDWASEVLDAWATQTKQEWRVVWQATNDFRISVPHTFRDTDFAGAARQLGRAFWHTDHPVTVHAYPSNHPHPVIRVTDAEDAR